MSERTEPLQQPVEGCRDCGGTVSVEAMHQGAYRIHTENKSFICPDEEK
jgi:hypothetical protein